MWSKMVAQEDLVLTFFHGHAKFTGTEGKITAEKELKISWTGSKQKSVKGPHRDRYEREDAFLPKSSPSPWWPQ